MEEKVDLVDELLNHGITPSNTARSSSSFNRRNEQSEGDTLIAPFRSPPRTLSVSHHNIASLPTPSYSENLQEQNAPPASPFGVILRKTAYRAKPFKLDAEDGLSLNQGNLKRTSHTNKLRSSNSPTDNVFVLKALESEGLNPWKNRALYLMSAHQMSTTMENVYVSTKSVFNTRLFLPHPKNIVVSGVPRSGQSPIIQALHSLKSGSVTPMEKLVDCVPWLEASYGNIPTTENPQVVKTHMSHRQIFGGDESKTTIERLPATFKVICVLRDPIDLRLSWFRHVRRVFSKLNPSEKFDQYFSPDNFAKISRAEWNAHVSNGLFDAERDYEDFIRESLRLSEAIPKVKSHFLIVFYEELLANPLAVVQKLSKFIGYGDEELVWKVAEEIKKSPGNPGNGKKKGSSYQGRTTFSPASVDWMDARWLDRVKVLNPDLVSYESLFEYVTGQTFPTKGHIPLQLPRKSSLSSIFSTTSTSELQKKASFTMFPNTSTAHNVPQASLSKIPIKKKSGVLKLFRRSDSQDEKDQRLNIPVDPDDSDDGNSH